MNTPLDEARLQFVHWVQATGVSNAMFIIKQWRRKRLEKGDKERPERERITPKQKEKMFVQQRGLCGICRKSMDFMALNSRDPNLRLEVDHINVNLAGPEYTARRNLQLAHGECNREKGALSVMAQTKHYSRTAQDILTGVVDEEGGGEDE